jgi:DNA-binding LacI/PurR family transcriptional regulator
MAPTTVHQDAAALAQHAVQLAVAMVEGVDDVKTDVVLQPSLVIRGTTAAPTYRSTSVVSK